MTDTLEEQATPTITDMIDQFLKEETGHGLLDKNKVVDFLLDLRQASMN